MAQSTSMAGSGGGAAGRAIGAFLAAAVAVLVFHQFALWVLHLLGIAGPPYNLAATKPLGVPVVLSLAFWGGLWGIPLAWLLRGRSGGAYWTVALVFGAVLPTLGAWFVVPLIKGLPTVLQQPLGTRLIVGPVVNGAWGIGTALLLKLLPGGLGART